MRKCLQKTLFSFLLMIMMSSSNAQVVKSISTADVPLPNPTRQSFQKALPDALLQVLVKMSGNPAVMTLPDVQNAIPTNVSSLVRSYSYHRRADAQGDQQLYLQVRFDQAALLHILRQSNQAIWRANRPLTLVWLNVQSSEGAQVLASGVNNAWSEDLRNNAFRRGLPYLLPAMDLQDQSLVSNNTDQPFNLDNLNLLAKRYDVSIVLAGDVTHAATGEWSAQWLLLLKGQQYRWNNTADSDYALVANAVDYAANAMANQFAVVDNQKMQSVVTLNVAGVNSLADYAKLNHFLKSLAPVASVTVNNMQSASVSVNVNVIGGAEALIGALANNTKLSQVVMPPQDAKADLYYRWQDPSSESQ